MLEIYIRHISPMQQAQAQSCLYQQFRVQLPIYTHVMAHCNTGYCTTLLHNKDVALKGFLRGCRLSRLNHVTLVFSVFLFYTSPSAFTLAYTIWYQSQTSFLASNKHLQQEKKILMHITIKSHTCLSAGSRLYGISQPPWLCAVSKSNNQAIHAHQAFA